VVNYRFGQYTFHTHGLRLERAGRRESIRPKTALLLSVLVENRDRIVSKRELFQLVWNTEFVQDHSLFQLISEIRKLSPGCELIRTQPNVGYQWVVKTEVCRFKRAHFVMAAVAVIAFLYAGFSVISPSTEGGNSNSLNGLQSFLPAMNAYSKGAVALENGELEKAEKWLRFSLAENPNSIDTRLLLAESLLQQNQLAAAETLAQSIMQAPENFAYSTSAAAELLSRIYQRQGSFYNALEYAIRGSKELDATQSLCTAEAFDHRIQVLSELIGKQSEFDVLSSPQKQEPGFGENLVSSAGLRGNDNYDECTQLKKSLSDDELSSCFEPRPVWYSTREFAAKENTFIYSDLS